MGHRAWAGRLGTHLTVGEPRIDGLVHENGCVKAIPPKLGLSKGHVVVDRVGAIFIKNGELGGAAGPTRHPQHH